MDRCRRSGLAAVGLAAALCAAGAAAFAESRRESPAFSGGDEETGDGGGVKGLFEGLGFGGDDGPDPEEEGTYVARFEAPELAAYEKLAADRSVTLAIQRASGYGLVAAPALNAYVDRVLQRIVAASPVPELDARVFVRAETRFAAHSTPDGSIYINIGLLQDIESEDELAAVLAHELAHVLYRHHATDWFADSQKIAAQGMSLVNYAHGMATGAQQTGKDSKSVLLAKVSGEMSERVVAPNLWNREQEREADGLGLDLLVAAGYQSGAATTALERLAFYEAESRKRTRQQLEEVAKAAEADMNEAVGSGDLSQIVVGLVEGAGTALGVAGNAAIDAVGGGDHDPAEVRGERLVAYINREYLLAPRPKATALPWQTAGDPTAPVLANYRTARKAVGAMADGDLAQAESLIRAAVGGPTSEDAYPRLVFSNLRAEQGDFAKAYQNLEIASGGAEPAFAVYRLMIEKQLSGGRPDEAVRLVDEATRRLDEAPNLFPYRIAVLVDAQKKTQAHALFAECKLSYPDLAPQCNRALSGLRTVAADDGSSDGSATDELLDREVMDPAKDLSTGFGQQ